MCLLTEGVNCPSQGFHRYLWGQWSFQTNLSPPPPSSITSSLDGLFFFHASKHSKGELEVGGVFRFPIPKVFFTFTNPTLVLLPFPFLHVCKCIFHRSIYALKLRSKLKNVDLSWPPWPLCVFRRTYLLKQNKHGHYCCILLLRPNANVDFIFAWNFYTIQLETLRSPFSFRNLMAKPSKVHFVQTSAASLHQAPVIQHYAWLKTSHIGEATFPFPNSARLKENAGAFDNDLLLLLLAWT